MNRENIRYDKKDEIATLTLNRPDKLNALSPQLLLELVEAIAEARNDDGVRVLVLTGAGRGFCSGADLSIPVEEKARFAKTLGRRIRTTPYNSMGAVAMALRDLPKPVIAAVNGAATGAGFAFSLACDIRIAAESARFSAIFVRRGLLPDCGITFNLPRVVGTAKALELFWTGEIIDAREAERIGLVSNVVPDEELMPTAYELAGRLAEGPALSIELSKVVTYEAMQLDLPAAMKAEAWAQTVCLTSEDVLEGRKAFNEKRQPRFEGK